MWLKDQSRFDRSGLTAKRNFHQSINCDKPQHSIPVRVSHSLTIDSHALILRKPLPGLK